MPTMPTILPDRGGQDTDGWAGGAPPAAWPGGSAVPQFSHRGSSPLCRAGRRDGG